MTTVTYFWNSWYHYPEKMGDFKLDYPYWITEEIRGVTYYLMPKNVNKQTILYLKDDIRLTICSAIPYRSPPYNAVNDPTTIIYKSYDVRPLRIYWLSKQIKQGSPFNEEFVKADWMKWPD